ncbi:hypothetical protein F4820DRAFT_453397 [Hypoxylon rubiginosum]|uniref:Uncharacterized protein n=1 Tax=Hypoxylon rubiginosum TaxID=110542 RepID=A0ACB9YLF7_9PEZI|nr:hypothetical protein F4820DRAFT_453397 [Hypoxylon rubiginosum]
MVVRTTSLSSLKNFFPKIHQPLPLTNRESRQLLDSITTSFRKNLDKEHPWEPSSGGEESTSHGSAAPQGRTPLLLKQTSPSPPLDASKRQHAADRHLRTILSNPLFAHQDTKKGPTSPFDVFDRAVSRGLMTQRRAAGFLSKVRSEIPGESADEIRRGMARSGAGLRVIQWLRASGLEDDPRFLDSNLPWLLVPFMYAEGLEEIAWGWVARLALRDGRQAENCRLRALVTLLHAIRKHSCTSYSGSNLNLDCSYEAVMRANEVLPKQSDVARRSLEEMWFSLSWLSTVLASERPKPSAPLFESFVDIGRPMGAPLDMAHLELHHPLSPSHSAAVRFMHDSAEREQRDPVLRRRLVCMALDATDRLRQVGDTDEASWVERFLARIGSDTHLGILMEQIRQASVPSELPISSQVPFRHVGN